MKENKKIKLIVQPLYSMIIRVILLLAMITLLIFPNIFWQTKQLMWKIIYNIFFSLITLICLYSLLQIIQISIISKTGIIIKNIFGNIACIEWKMIASIRNEKLVTYDSRGTISLNWIVIRTENSQTAHKYAKNKSSAPWQINANTTNIAKINTALKLYRPDLSIETH